MSQKIHREVVDSYYTANEKRTIQLVYLRGVGVQKPWVIEVYVRRSSGERVSAYLTLLSTSEYYQENNARYDFEMRRPYMREDKETVEHLPMNRGKRVVQEMLTEKLGPKR